MPGHPSTALGLVPSPSPRCTPVQVGSSSDLSGPALERHSSPVRPARSRFPSPSLPFRPFIPFRCQSVLIFTFTLLVLQPVVSCSPEHCPLLTHRPVSPYTLGCLNSRLRLLSSPPRVDYHLWLDAYEVVPSVGHPLLVSVLGCAWCWQLLESWLVVHEHPVHLTLFLVVPGATLELLLVQFQVRSSPLVQSGSSLLSCPQVQPRPVRSSPSPVRSSGPVRPSQPSWSGPSGPGCPSPSSPVRSVQPFGSFPLLLRRPVRWSGPGTQVRQVQSGRSRLPQPSCPSPFVPLSPAPPFVWSGPAQSPLSRPADLPVLLFGVGARCALRARSRAPRGGFPGGGPADPPRSPPVIIVPALRAGYPKAPSSRIVPFGPSSSVRCSAQQVAPRSMHWTVLTYRHGTTLAARPVPSRSPCTSPGLTTPQGRTLR